MRMNVPIVLLAALLLQTCCYSAKRQASVSKTNTIREDPMFGSVFDYTKVKFQALPTHLRSICDTGKENVWIFAHTHRQSGDYYVVLGVGQGRDNTGRGDPLGVTLVVDGSECSGMDSTGMLSGFVPENGYNLEEKPVYPPQFIGTEACEEGELGPCHYILQSAEEEAIIRELAKDGIQRGIKAFGGKAAFKKAACTRNIIEANSNTPIVQQELRRFCSQR